MRFYCFTVALGVALILGSSTATLQAEEKGKRCTKTSVSCFDKINKKARTCVTETCTFADGRATTTVTVELVSGGGGTKPKRPRPAERAPTAAGIKQ